MPDVGRTVVANLQNFVNLIAAGILIAVVAAGNIVVVNQIDIELMILQELHVEVVEDVSQMVEVVLHVNLQVVEEEAYHMVMVVVLVLVAFFK